MNGINLPEVFIANGMGIMILFITLIGNLFRFKQPSRENLFLLIIFFLSLGSCILDPICFLVDGQEGILPRIAVYLTNTLLYINGLGLGFMWILLIFEHNHCKIPKIHLALLIACFAIVITLLIINIFYPVTFSISDSNVYKREFGYWIYTAVYLGYMVDGVISFLVRYKQSQGFKFFPLWAFLIPTTVGVVTQAVYYGVSTANPSITISLACVLMSLQNETMYRDKFTGLYNRFFLNIVESKLKRKTRLTYCIAMIDINAFKTINDRFGHKEGDKAILKLTDILVSAVDRKGEVIRYAGDEFIILIYNDDIEKAKLILEDINSRLDEANRKNKLDYEISVSSGVCKINLANMSMNEAMDEADKIMYQNKEVFYQNNKRLERRKS